MEQVFTGSPLHSILIIRQIGMPNLVLLSSQADIELQVPAAIAVVFPEKEGVDPIIHSLF